MKPFVIVKIGRDWDVLDQREELVVCFETLLSKRYRLQSEDKRSLHIVQEMSKSKCMYVSVERTLKPVYRLLDFANGVLPNGKRGEHAPPVQDCIVVLV